MSPKKTLVWSVLLSLAFLVAPALAAEAPTSGAAAKPASVTLKDSLFSPQVVMIQANMSVTWTNKDTFAHDVTSYDGLFNSTGGGGGMAAGATFAMNFTTPGVYDYYCTLHPPATPRAPGMWGRVIVVEAPFIAMAGAADVENPEHIGVNWLAHWVGIVSFVCVVITLLIYYFVLKFGETIHTTDHRDRKEK